MRESPIEIFRTNPVGRNDGGRYASMGLIAISILINDEKCDSRVVAVVGLMMIAGYALASFRPMGFVLGDDVCSSVLC